MEFPRLAKHAGECDAAEGILAAIFARDERSVKSTHQNVIPERGGVVLFRVCGGKRRSGPRERKCVMSTNPIGLQHVAAFIYIEAIGRIGWVARRIEHTRGSEGVASTPANDLAASHEIEVAGGKTCICFFHVELCAGVVVSSSDSY